jgi:hypothetical protein
MKKAFWTYISVAIGAFVGNVVYVHTIGDPNDYHWMRPFVFSIFLGIIFLLKKYNRPVA